jgi:hypothetical protein
MIGAAAAFVLFAKAMVLPLSSTVHGRPQRFASRKRHSIASCKASLCVLFWK